MMRFVREFRLIPVVLLAITALFGLKVLGIILDGGYTLTGLDFGGGDQLGNRRLERLLVGLEPHQALVEQGAIPDRDQEQDRDQDLDDQSEGVIHDASNRFEVSPAVSNMA